MEIQTNRVEIQIMHENSKLNMPSGTASVIGNGGIVKLYYREFETSFYFKRIVTAEKVLVKCYNSTDFELAQAFINRIQKQLSEQSGTGTD